VNITEHGRVVGGLTINNADEQDVDGRLGRNGALTLHVAGSSTLTGRFDGHSFSGKVVWHDLLTTDRFSFAIPADVAQLQADAADRSERCRMIGSLGAFAASLDVAVKNDGFVAGQLNVDGRRFAIVQGILEGDELILECADRYDPTTGTAPRLVGRFDRQTFSGAFVSYDPCVWSRKMVILFQFVASSSC